MVNKLEVTWTLIVVGLIAGVAVYSTFLLYNIDSPSTKPTEYVDVIGHQWYWEFCYPQNGTCWNTTYDATTNTATGGAMWVEPDAEVQINVTSTDVIHSFNIPALGIRLDAIPGRNNSLVFGIPDASAGTQYLVQCTEFCGEFHGTMRAFVVVV